VNYTPVSAAEFDELGLDDWRYVLNSLRATFRAGSFAAAAALIAAIVDAADAADHHPDIDLRYPDLVTVAVSTHFTGGTTVADTDLAARISALAADAGAHGEPLRAQAIEIAIDTMDDDAIRPFWAAVLGYRDADGALVDPAGLGPPLWFQQMDELRRERGRFHLDISVPHDVAASRVAAALAAGGTLVSDANARAWWVLADADGNEACISTWQDR
jgi:4a-hydroxytetrahydrobiopterin dehydratase